MKHTEMFIKINIVISKGGSIPLAVGGMSHPKKLSGIWKDEHMSGTLLFYIRELSFHELGTLRRLWMLREKGRAGVPPDFCPTPGQPKGGHFANLPAATTPYAEQASPYFSLCFLCAPQHTLSNFFLVCCCFKTESLAQTGFRLF